MKWNEIRIETTGEASDAVSEMLTSIGAGGVAIEDPEDIRAQVLRPDSLDYADDKFLDGLGEDVVIKAYFSGEISVTELTGLIKEKLTFISRFLDVGKGYAGYAEVDDEDWAVAWKKYYKPFHISDHIVIKPSWEAYEIDRGDILIELDPGMAFGTGTHETTRMCAQLLEKYIQTGDTVIDVGCGSGILSIIAAKLGAEHVAAVDLDEMAVRITRENSNLNGVGTIVDAFRGTMEDIDRQMEARIVVANIIANVIIDIAPGVLRHLKAKGLLLTSGIIKERSQEVVDCYAGLGFNCEEAIELGEWVAMVFKCQGSL